MGSNPATPTIQLADTTGVPGLLVSPRAPQKRNASATKSGFGSGRSRKSPGLTPNCSPYRRVLPFSLGAASDAIPRVAALFVDPTGCYAGLPGVDVWGIDRDARLYSGPHLVVAHPPCQLWGRYAESHPTKGARYREAGQDDGCFSAAFRFVRAFGGVIEHPAYSKAWAAFGIIRPHRDGGWTRDEWFGGWTCHVEQGHYGHFSRKPTWLYAVHPGPPELIWGPSEQRLPAYAVERYGYAKARRIGVMAAVGGKDKTRIRNATPLPFRDLLLSIASSAWKAVASPSDFQAPFGKSGPGIGPEMGASPNGLGVRGAGSQVAS